MKLLQSSPVCTILLTLLFIFGVAIPVRAELSRTLLLGARGSDVKELQVILNSNPSTMIAPAGPGSKGQETDYFGALTKKAVELFQKKYAPEVLFPAGIYTPTGVVGTFTRAKLNKLSTLGTNDASSPIPTAVASLVPPRSAVDASTAKNPPDISGLFTTKSKPLIFSLSRYEVKHGDTVVVTGSGFLPTGNSLVFDTSYRVDNLTSADGTSLSVLVPHSVPNGSYNISVENKNGTTFNATYGNFFTISDNPQDPPTVSRVTPDKVVFDSNSTITITGTGFSPEKNEVYTGLGSASGIPSSDGKTLSVTLSSLSEFKRATQYASALKSARISVPMFVVVKTSAGISSTKASFLLQY